MEAVAALGSEMSDRGGYDEVSLTALSTADVSCIAPLVAKVSDELSRRKVAMCG